MRVGVYIDGYNLYYGGRKLCGRSTSGWRWLDPRALANAIVTSRPEWPSAAVSRVVYCTARVDASTNPSAASDQDVYLKALTSSAAVDWIEYGNYVARVKRGLLATKGAAGKPEVVSSNWPIMVRDAVGGDVAGANFMVSYLHSEEKGSDVNVATHLLHDVYTGAVDAAVIVSNDSDLKLPLVRTRDRVPVGLVNPQGGYFAGALRAKPHVGVGNHWEYTLTKGDFVAHQMPATSGGYTIPVGW